MTLAQLRYLAAVADAGLNISRAARNVYATQSCISRQLKQLEDELGFAIFTRKGRSLDAITKAGEQVIQRARTVLTETRQIRALGAERRLSRSP